MARQRVGVMRSWRSEQDQSRFAIVVEQARRTFASFPDMTGRVKRAECGSKRRFEVRGADGSRARECNFEQVNGEGPALY
jgi:hypothetical protein